MTLSRAIDEAVSLAEADGNKVKEVSTGWTKVREVVHMEHPMSAQLMARLSSMAQLRGWAVEPTPQNKAEQGFTDDAEKVSISFPAAESEEAGRR
jgi:hypothetical protein